MDINAYNSKSKMITKSKSRYGCAGIMGNRSKDNFCGDKNYIKLLLVQSMFSAQIRIFFTSL